MYNMDPFYWSAFRWISFWEFIEFSFNMRPYEYENLIEYGVVHSIIYYWSETRTWVVRVPNTFQAFLVSAIAFSFVFFKKRPVWYFSICLSKYWNEFKNIFKNWPVLFCPKLQNDSTTFWYSNKSCLSHGALLLHNRSLYRQTTIL